MTADKYLTYARLLAVVAGIMLLTLITGTNANAAPYGTYPVNTVAGEVIAFNWYDTPTAPSYTLQVALDANFTDIFHVNSNAGRLISVSGFNDDGRIYYWRVIANDNGRTSATLSFVNGPSAAPDSPTMGLPSDDRYLGGRNGIFIWMTPRRAYNNKVTAATDIFFFNKIYDEAPTENFYVLTDKLPGDGSKIYWKVQSWNSKGYSDPSPTYSFINDCYMASVGSGGGLTHIDTCSDDYTSRNGSFYLLKDISRRADNNPHLHNGEMADSAAIITGLNSDNVVNAANDEKPAGVPIIPLSNLKNIWDATTETDAIHTQAYTGRFYDYLLRTFKARANDSNFLNSYDGNGSSLYNLVKGGKGCGIDPPLAYWNMETLTAHFCSKVSDYPELVGHEWAHALAITSSKRSRIDEPNTRETGALDEAFSDWLGMAFKRADYPKDWKFASEDFADINRKPNYYKANGYLPSSDEQTNSRVPSTMFYLLANGGEHPFSKIKVGKLNGGVLQGIGIETAMQIAFRANMEYWKNDVIFSNAATQMSDAATDHFSHDRNYPSLLH